MTQNINIGGEIKLTINNDATRVIRFDPTSVDFAEGFYNLLQRIETLETSYTEHMAELELNTEVDAHGIPTNEGDKFRLLHNLCDTLKTEVDAIFGEGTSEAAFKGAASLEMFEDLFNGVAPYIQQARAKKVDKYTVKANTDTPST